VSATVETDVTPKDVTPKGVSPHMTRAVIATIFFFLPVGLFAVYFSVKAQSAIRGGDLVRAARAARISTRFSLAAFILGVLIYLFLALAFLALGAFAASA
jgi:uncharacterized membrane protein YozB (DUF420 family)